MNILLTGATGLIGKELGKMLVESGHRVRVVSRNKKTAKEQLSYPAEIIQWDYEKEDFPEQGMQNIDAVINLAGESIGNNRWSKKIKQRIYHSRIDFTKKLALAAKIESQRPQSKLKTFISASAVGIYPDSLDHEYIEDSQKGDSFLSRVCKEWEKATSDLAHHNVRVSTVRIGVVLSSKGGALEKLIPLFSTGLGGAIGSGKQWMSWIHLEDLARLFIHILNNPSISGPVNGVAPTPVTNKEFSFELAKSLGRNLFFPVPSIMLKIILGEMSAIVLESQKVSSKKAQDLGFKFKFGAIKEAFEEICSPFKNGHKELYVEQWVPQQPHDIFPFFCDENNLEKLTPKSLGFKVLGKSTKEIEQGTLIDYKLSLRGVPMKWKTLIDEWSPNDRFVDMQLKGPYERWHHTHTFVPFAGGTLLQDRVSFKVPFGWLGNLVSFPFVYAEVKGIFSYRRQVIAKLYYHE